VAKQFDLGFYDMVNNDLYVQPAFYLDKIMVSFPVHYDNIRVSDKRYLDMVSFGNMSNIMLDRENMVHVSFIHDRKYFNWPATRDNDTRDARDYTASLGWYYFFAKNYEGFVNARYAINYEDTKGANWTYLGNRFTLSSVLPVSKIIRWSVAGDYYRQDFVKDNSTYEKERYDDVVTLSNVVAVKVYKDFEIQLQHTFVDDAAGIGVFKYKRNVYSVGVKYGF